MNKSPIFLHHEDLPSNLNLGASVALDTETMGLNTKRDPLCLVQLSAGDGTAHIVRLNRQTYDAPNLKNILSDPDILKIFHYARFDISALAAHLNIETFPVYCTKIASKLARTYTDRHGLKDLCRDLLGMDLSKQKQESDWGAEELSQAQLNYAAGDVLYLHKLKSKLDDMLLREGRMAMAEACFHFLPMRAHLDRAGWAETDIFSH